MKRKSYVKHEVHTYPFWHTVSKLTISNTKDPISKQIMEIHNNSHKQFLQIHSIDTRP